MDGECDIESVKNFFHTPFARSARAGKGIFRNPNTTARYIKKLGVQVNNLDRVFEKREAAKVLSFTAHKLVNQYNSCRNMV